MASTDYFSRSASSARPSVLGPSRTGAATPGTPLTPRTPSLSRSLSSQFNSPASRPEPDEIIVYELHERFLAAGFAGESRPRCYIRFDADSGRRVGDYRAFDPAYETMKAKRPQSWQQWRADHELYRADLRGLDLGLVEDKLERAVRRVHTEVLQLDSKARKAVLVLPNLCPSPVVERVLGVLFGHFAGPTGVALLTRPVMCCVAAGVRNGLVVEVGWEETVVTAVGEYRECGQGRSCRGGKMLMGETKKLLDQEAAKSDGEDEHITYDDAEEVVDRMVYCRPSISEDRDTDPTTTTLPLSNTTLTLPFASLASPAEVTFFPPHEHYDNHETPLPDLLYSTLLALPLELRALCLNRIILTGSHSSLPGLKSRLLAELSERIRTRSWDPVASYGSDTARRKALRNRSSNLPSRDKAQATPRKTSAPPSDPIAPILPPASERKHDDLNDRITQKAEKELLGRVKARERDKVSGSEVRGVDTLGAWAGASLVAQFGIKGVWEVEREEFLKHGLRGQGEGAVGGGGGGSGVL